MRFNPRIVVCALLLLLVTDTAHAQLVVPNTPTSGAILTIKDSQNNILLNLYDSQIHSGVVGTVPLSPCTSADAVVQTDAYALQGGSATGCKAPDLYEITDVATSTTTFTPRTDSATHQNPGAKDIGGFHIETHFICVGKCANNVSTKTKTFCNTSLTICINVVSGVPADNGFVVVKNTSNSNFTGTIILQGTSTTGCAASDSATFSNASPLLPLGSVTLAMGTPGTVAAPNTLDSSTCGGFNYDQMQPLINNQQAVFLFGRDDFIVKCSNCNAGDVATFRPVPMPQSLFSVAANSPFGFGQSCITYADFSSPNPAQPYGVCPEFQTHCLNGGVTCADAESFNWGGRLDFIIDQNTIPNVISGVHFLGEPIASCPQNIFASDIALSYTGVQPGTDAPPLTAGGGGGLNCFVPTYDPTAAPIVAGQQVFAFNGWFSPDKPPPTINPENAGQNVTLPFFYANGAGGTGVTNLSWCESGPVVPGSQVCQDGTPAPWVAVKRTPFTCPGFPPGSTNSTDGFIGPATNSFMHNQGGGLYSINWATSNTEPTTNNCFWLGVLFNSEQSNPFVGEFQFVK